MTETQQKTKTITLTREEIDAMDPDEFNNLLMKATKISGTAVVRDAHGNVKYDNPELAGTYGEEHL